MLKRYTAKYKNTTPSHDMLSLPLCLQGLEQIEWQLLDIYGLS